MSSPATTAWFRTSVLNCRTQKEALHYGVKEPYIYTHVAIRNWMAFHKLGIRQIVSPGSYHCFTMLDFPVTLGTYQFPSNPRNRWCCSCCARHASRAGRGASNIGWEGLN